MSRKSTIFLSLTTLGLFSLTAVVSVAAYRSSARYAFESATGGHYLGEVEPEIEGVYAHKFIKPSDNRYATQKNYSMNIVGDIESVWDNYTGAGTTIAIIDDGFSYTHSEFTRSDNTSAISQDSAYFYESGSSYGVKYYKNDPTCIDEEWNDEENEWDTHGSNVASTAAAPMGNGGIVGIAPEATILALKVDFEFVSIRAAINYAVSKGADVINMSLGAYADTFTDGFGDQQSGSSVAATYLNSACQAAYNAGVIVVAAAGNEATYHKSYPACNSKVIGVGALYQNDDTTLAPFTNYVRSNQTGEVNVDILAPGFVFAAGVNGGKSNRSNSFFSTQGTSFSSPIVAGAAALWKQKNPDGNTDEFLEDLQASAARIGEYQNKYVPVSKYQGYDEDVGPSNITQGRLDVAALMSVDSEVSGVEVNPSEVTLYIGEGGTTLTANVLPTTADNKGVSWSSSDTSIVTVDSTGKLTPKDKEGDAVITVTTDEGGFTATCTVHVVHRINPTAIVLGTSSIQVMEDKTCLIDDVSLLPENVSEKTWWFESLDTSIATVDENTGLVTGVKEGKTQIRVYTYNLDTLEEIEAFIEVTVTAPLIKEKTLDFSKTAPTSTTTTKHTWDLDPFTVTNEKNNGSSFAAYQPIRVYQGNKFTIQWPDDVTVDHIDLSYNTGYSNMASGWSSNCTNSAPSTGTRRVVPNGDATSVYYVPTAQTRINSLTIYYSTPIAGPSVSSVTLPESSKELNVGDSYQLQPVVTMDDSSVYEGTIDYVSNAPTIASVDSDGLIHALAEGVATITASAGGKSASIVITVIDPNKPVLTSISLQNVPETVPFMGELSTSGIVATAHYSDDSSKAVSSSVIYSSIDTSQIGYQTVTASFTEDDVEVSTQFTVFVTNIGAERGSTVIPGVEKTCQTSSASGKYFGSASASISLCDVTWTIATDAGYFSYDSGCGNHIGSNKKPASYINITSSGLTGKIESVTVSTYSGSSATLQVSVGGVAYRCNGNTSVTVGSSSGSYTFVGESSGNVELSYSNTNNKAIYFDSVTLHGESSVEYDWSGDAQASSFLNYLKTFEGSCASGFASRDEVVRLVGEYNALIEEAKASTILAGSFTDKGYSTDAVNKLKTMVREYNSSLEGGESVLTLNLPNDSSYQGHESKALESNGTNVALVALLALSAIGGLGICLYVRRRRQR